MMRAAEQTVTAQRVIYDATYEFDPPAGAMALRFCLRPLPRPGQITRGVRIATFPECEERRLGTDAYGVVVETASIARPVRRLQVNADLTVVPAPAAAMPDIGPRAGDLWSEEDRATPRRDAACARDITCAEGLALVRAAARGWIYDVRAAPSMRPLATLGGERRGSCEDVARLCADALRRHGVPVRFIVGYLGSLDALASRRHRRHAWLAIWTCDRGWCEIDPLNTDASGPLIATSWGPELAALQPIAGSFATGRVKRASVEIQILSSPG